MEDWKYEMFVKLKRDDPDAFAGLDLNYNMKQCYQRQADRNFEIINGNLCQAVKSKKKVTKWLTEDIPDAPKLNVHYTVEVVREIKWVAVARQSDRTKLFYEAHDERGHPGRDPTLAFIKLSQHWWGMKQDVEKYIRSCEICQRTRVDETKPPLEHIIEDEPFGRWQIDLTQIPGVPGYFLVVIDCFTKFVWFKFLPTKHAVGVLSFLMALVKKEGRKPRKIHSDNGGEFIADILKQFCEEFGIELIHGRPYHPQSQGQVERVNRTLKAMLYKMLEARFGGKDGVSSEDLESSFDEVVDLYNNNKHSSTGFSPMQLQRPIIKTPTKDISLPKLKQIQHKEMVSLFAIAHDNLVKAAEKQDKVHNAKHHSKLRVFKVGQKVLYRWPVELRANGDFLYNSIARITKEHKNGRYGLEWLENEPSNSKNRKTWSAGELKLYRERDANNNIEQVSVQNPSDVSSEGDIGEKQMDEVEEQGNRQFSKCSLTNFCPESIAPECNNTGDGNNTNVRSAPNDLCSLYDGLMDADDQITEDQWLELTDPLPTDTEKDQEIEECNTEKELNANQPSDCQPTNAPDYQVYQPRKRRRITQTSKGSQSRLWKEIGLNNDD